MIFSENFLSVEIFLEWRWAALLSLPALAQTARVYILLTVWRALCKLHLIHSHINIRLPLWFCYILNHATLLSEQWQRVIQSCEQTYKPHKLYKPYIYTSCNFPKTS